MVGVQSDDSMGSVGFGSDFNLHNPAVDCERDSASSEERRPAIRHQREIPLLDRALAAHIPDTRVANRMVLSKSGRIYGERCPLTQIVFCKVCGACLGKYRLYYGKEHLKQYPSHNDFLITNLVDPIRFSDSELQKYLERIPNSL